MKVKFFNHSFRTLTTGGLLVCSLLFSCKKEQALTVAGGIGALKVPEGFNWQLTKSYNLSVSTKDMRFGNAIQVVAVYDDQGNLLSKGAATPVSPFKTTIRVPSASKKIYLINTAFDGTRTVSDAGLVNADLSVVMAGPAATPVVKNIQGTGVFTGPDPESPDCSGGLNEVVTPNAADEQVIAVTNGRTVGIQGDFRSKSIKLNYGEGGGTFRICATNVRITFINLDAEYLAIKGLVITQGSTVTFNGTGNSNTIDGSNLSIPGSIVNYGTVVFSGQGYNYIKGGLTNYGTVTTEGLPTVYLQGSGSQSYNYGTISLYKFFFGNGTFSNHAIVKTSSSCTVTSGDLINYCTLVPREISLGTSSECKLTNQVNASLVTSKLSVTGRANVDLYPNSMIDAGTIALGTGGIITQKAGSSLFKLDQISDPGGTGTLLTIDGPVALCNQAGTLSAYITDGKIVLTNGPQLTCAIAIPSSSCSPGFGNASLSDTDLDGVPDALDDFPTDPTLAFNNPSLMGTLLFEDQWPKTGDYDMNDLVMSYRYKVYTNANNDAVKVVADYTLRATGGFFDNAFAVAFPFRRDNVTTIQGGTLEAGQQNAVLVLFTSMHAELPFWNVRSADPVAAPKNYHVEIGIVPYGLGALTAHLTNPFVWNDGAGFGRGAEIHLMDNDPSALANFSLFGQFNDRSVLHTTYYKSDLGLPWALDIPSLYFKYPKEGEDITRAYLKLADWVQSGGTLYRDWYTNTSAEYRDVTKIYSP